MLNLFQNQITLQLNLLKNSNPPLLNYDDKIENECILEKDELMDLINSNDITFNEEKKSKLKKIKKLNIHENYDIFKLIYLIQSCPNLTHLSFLEQKDLTDDKLKLIVKSCPKLIDLGIFGINTLSENIFLFLPESLQSLHLGHSSMIKHVNLQRFKNLKKIWLDCSQLKSINHLSNNIVSLRISKNIELEAQSLSHLTHLEHLELRGKIKGKLNHLPSGIKDLGLFDCSALSEINLKHMTKLEELFLSDFNTFNHSDAYHFPIQLKQLKMRNFLITNKELKKLPNLKTLIFKNCDIDSCMVKALPTQIRFLVLICCKQLSTNVDLSHLIHLEKLNLGDCNHLLNDCLKTLPTSLENLNIIKCSQISKNDSHLIPSANKAKVLIE